MQSLWFHFRFEGFLLLFTYGIYCIALYFNEALELWVSQYPPFNTLKNIVCPTKLAEDPNRHLEDLNTPRYSTTEENITIDRAEVNRASNGSITADHNVIYYKPKEPRPSEVRILTKILCLLIFHFSMLLLLIGYCRLIL